MHDADLPAAQRIGVRVGAGLGGVEDEMRHGADQVAVGRGDAAGAEAGAVVRQVAGVGLPGGGEREELSVGDGRGRG